MNNKTIEISIQVSGEISVEAVGFHGVDCERATAFLEEALGVTVKKVKKPQYHQRIIKRQRIGS